MTSVTARTFDKPDELRTPPKANVAIVDVSGNKVARLTLEPGWRWSECIKPIAETESCMAHHLGVLSSGRMHVQGADGLELEIQAGEAYEIQPGHDAWVVGDEPVVTYEFDSSAVRTFAATPAA